MYAYVTELPARLPRKGYSISLLKLIGERWREKESDTGVQTADTRLTTTHDHPVPDSHNRLTDSPPYTTLLLTSDNTYR